MNSTNLLTVNRTNKTLSTEVSCLELTDNAPNQIAFRSAKTGQVALFHLSHIESREGDTLYWEFLPTHETLVSNPSLNGWTLTVFND
jgi:hypothetical protein